MPKADNSFQQKSYNNDNGFGNQGLNGFEKTGYKKNTFKVENTTISQPLSTGFSDAPAFVPASGPVDNAPWKKFTKAGGFKLPTKDTTSIKLKECGVTDDKEIDEIKDLIVLMKASKENKVSEEQKKKIDAIELNERKASEGVKDESAPAAMDTRKTYLEMVERRPK